MANLIQIKRSLNTANATSLANGEMAFSANGDVLWIGSNSSIIPIAGIRTPGTLTANQALVANANSAIDKVIVANAVITSIYANSAIGSTGQLLTANSTGGIHWSTPAPSVVGSNTQVQFNDSGALAADAGLTYNKDTDNLTVANSVLAATVNAASFTVGTAFTANATVVNAAAINVTGQVNTSTFYAATSANVGTAVVANATGVYTTGTVNAAAHTTSGVTINATSIVPASNTSGHLLGNSTARFALSATTIAAGNTSITGFANVSTSVNTALFTVGTTFTANATLVNAAAINITGQVNTATLYATTSANIASAVQANSTGIFTTGTVNGAIVSVGNSVVANTTSLRLGNSTVAVALVANGGNGSAGQVLTSNATATFWATPTTGTVTSVATGNGLSGGTITATGTVSAVANNGIVANSTGLFANVANGLTTTGGAINVVGGNTIVSNTTGVYVNRGATLTANSTGLHVNTALSIVDLTLSGNLTVQGTLTTLDTVNLQVKDPLIKLADQNTTTDTLSLGIYGVYGNATVTQYTGLYRETASNTWALFNTQKEPTTTVDSANATYGLGSLRAFLVSGGLVSNATNISITANSTLAVAINANTLTLPTSVLTGNSVVLANSTGGLTSSLGTDGQVLQSNGTAVLFATLDGGTF
jgi:ribosomal protein L13